MACKFNQSQLRNRPEEMENNVSIKRRLNFAADSSRSLKINNFIFPIERLSEVCFKQVCLLNAPNNAITELSLESEHD